MLLPRPFEETLALAPLGGGDGASPLGPDALFEFEDQEGHEQEAERLADLEAEGAEAAGRIRTRLDVLREAESAWGSLADLRIERKRLRDVLASIQWFEYTDPETGEEVDEEAEIRRSGRIPWVMNRTRPILRNLKGQYRQNKSERMAFATTGHDPDAVEQLNMALRAVRRRNQARILEADGFEEHLISGLTAKKVCDEYVRDLDRYDVVIDSVHPSRLFFNRDLKDRRGVGLRIIGELHDCTIEEILEQFAQTRAEEAVIRALYAGEHAGDRDWEFPAGFEAVDALDFAVAVDPRLCRLIEVWRLEGAWVERLYDPLNGAFGPLAEFGISQAEVAAENAHREASGEPPIELFEEYERVWFCYFLTPWGHVLLRRETPFWHQGHPYSLALAWLLDGRIMGLIRDLVDPQRMLNRMYAQIDHMLGVNPRGLWIIDERQLPAGWSSETWAQQASKVGGVVVYRNVPGAPPPSHVAGAAVPVAAFQFLAQQGDFMDQISGVSNAVRGEEPLSGTPAALYHQQILQSATGSLDLFETYYEGLNDHDVKVVQCILQYYDEERAIKAGPGSQVFTYDPQRVRALHYDVSFGNVTETATYRQLFEQDLKDLLAAGRLALPQYLQESSHPRAMSLLRLVEQTNPLLQTEADPALAQQLAQAAEAGDPDAAAYLLQAQEWEAAAPDSAQDSF